MVNFVPKITDKVQEEFNRLAQMLKGEIHRDRAMRILYATDASVYRELPLAVAIPKGEQDLIELVKFARNNQVSLIPRTAGTSLAGQVVGEGIVVDMSNHFGKVLEINSEENWVRVQPGIVRDDLNKYLAPYGLMFGPETATANRAMIGGMIGNNSRNGLQQVFRLPRGAAPRRAGDPAVSVIGSAQRGRPAPAPHILPGSKPLPHPEPSSSSCAGERLVGNST